ncbi:helix-turn-helix transcriptional regulator [Aquimarina addita]|uniref:Helix-turn-helix transcriptional regulator n=2 Tax=Aquimarina addita TaxID=870485 RepID=A0ABP7XES4_9FLAO
MDHYDLSASAFADSLAIGRSSISHILSGRNKPSLDFAMKVVHTYSDVNFYWLLEGKGTFPPSEKPLTKIEKVSDTTPIAKSDPIPEDIAPQKDLFSQHAQKITAPILESNKNLDNPNLSRPHVTHKKINRIVIFYSDGSFEDYQNKES